MDVHRALAHQIRDAFQTSRGTFLKMLGDGCFAAFDSPVAAIDFGRIVIAGVDAELRVAAAAGSSSSSPTTSPDACSTPSTS